MSNLDRLYERFNFYKNTYQETKSEVFELEEETLKIKEDLEFNYFNLVDTFLGEEFTEEERKTVEVHFGLNLIDLDKKYRQIKRDFESEIKEIKEDPVYKEYLHIVITDDLDYAIKLENDEVFLYLIDQDFHNEQFKNEPYFELFGLKYQPRHWKFSKFANKKAKEMGFNNYGDMFKLWQDLRATYESLIGEDKIEDVVKESKRLKQEIKDIEDKILNIPSDFLQEVKTRLVEILFIINDSKFNIFGKTEEVNNILSIRKEFNLTKNGYEKQKSRLDILFDNLNKVEQLITAAENGNINIEDNKFEKLLSNTDPTIPIFELIPESEWVDIKKAFEDKGIKMKNKDDYTVVKTKVTAKQKKELLKKYNVKEGEIFIDPDLVGKRY